MENENYSNIKNKLLKAIKENRDVIKQFESKIERISRGNSLFSFKNYFAILISIIVFFAMHVFTATTTSIFPIFIKIAPELCLLTGIGSGLISSKIISKKFKVKERLERISNAKKRCDLLEESAEYELEKEKLLNRNRVLENVIINLESSMKLNDELNETNYIDQGQSSLSKDQFENNINILENIIKQKLNDLDTATVKNFIDTKFFIRGDTKKTIQVISSILLAIAFPVFYSSPDLTIGSPISFVRLLVSLIAGGIVGFKSIDKISQNHNRLYEKYNNQLVNSEGNCDEKRNSNDLQIESIINEISNMMLISEKMKLELSKTECDPIETQEEPLIITPIYEQTSFLQNHNDDKQSDEKGPELVMGKNKSHGTFC